MENLKTSLEKRGIMLEGFDYYIEDPTCYKKEVIRNDKYMLTSKYYRTSPRRQRLYILMDIQINEIIYYGYKMRDLIIKMRGLTI